MFFRNLLMALTSLRQNKLRSFLTSLGIIIGVSSVVTVLAIGAGVKKSISDQVASFGANLVQVNPGQAFSEEGGGFNFAASLGASTLTEQDVTTIQEIPNVSAAAPVMIISGVPSNEGREHPSAFTLATTPDLLSILNRELATGRFITQDDQYGAVVGAKIAEQLLGSEPLNKIIKFRGKEFVVVGTMKKEETSGLTFGPSLDDVMYVPFDTGKELSGGVANIIEIDITINDANNVDQAVTTIKERLKANHGGETDFTVLTAEDQLKIFNQIFTIMTSFVAAIAAISLLVGGIGVMNIMLVSVTERTREIGIRKAIGASNWHILTQFLIEALVLTLTGGILAIAVAFLMSLVIKLAADLTPIFTVNAFIIAIGISTLIGIVFGLTPAIKAARKNPIEALRYE